MRELNYILCVGDSLTYGARDEYMRSYPAELSRLIWDNNQKQYYCLNHGINGESSSALLRRIYNVSRSCTQANIALLLIGTNDTFIQQDLKIYRDNLRQIINVLRENREHIVVGLLPPALGPGLPNYPANAQAQINKFNEVIPEVAEAYKCGLVDFRNLGQYIVDTVHFGHEGYCKMAEIWYQELNRRNLI